MIQINDRIINPPQSWNDLEKKQLFMIFSVLSADFTKLLTAEEILWATRIGIMRIICGLSDEFVKDWRSIRIAEYGEEDGLKLFNAELRALTEEVTEPFFEIIETDDDELGSTASIRPTDKKRKYTIRHALTRNPYPQLEFEHGEIWHAPADNLQNLTIYELGATFTLFETYVKNESPDIADKLLATLYRPAKDATTENLRSNYEGDIRLPYAKHETTVPARAEKFKKVPDFCKQLLLFWFSSCRQHIIESYPAVFAEGSDVEPDPFGWGGLLLTIAENPANIDAVASQPHGNILTHLSILEHRRKKQVLKELAK